MQVTIGCELEGGLLTRGGLPVDTLAVLDGGKKSHIHRHEAVTSDLHLSSVELISTICRNSDEIRTSLGRCEAMIPEGYRPIFKTRPFGPRATIADKPRYTAIAQALLREHPKGDQCIHTVAPWCSTQFHFGVPNVFSREAVLLANFLNNITPHARLAVIKRYGVTDTEGHLAIWRGWSAEHRAPSPRWFASPGEMERFVAGIPKVVTQKDGIWMPAEGPSRIGDLESEGTIWWLARPRGVYKTVEWRPFPSLTPEQVVDLAADVHALVCSFWDYVEAHPSATWETREQAERLYRHLIGSDLVPGHPLSNSEWWQLYEK